MPQWSEDREKIYQGAKDIVDMIMLLRDLIKRKPGVTIMDLVNEGMDLKNLIDHARSYPSDQIDEYLLNVGTGFGFELTWELKRPVKGITP